MGDMNLRRCLDEAETYGEIKEIADYTDASAFRSFMEHLEVPLSLTDGREFMNAFFEPRSSAFFDFYARYYPFIEYYTKDTKMKETDEALQKVLEEAKEIYYRTGDYEVAPIIEHANIFLAEVKKWINGIKYRELIV